MARLCRQRRWIQSALCVAKKACTLTVCPTLVWEEPSVSACISTLLKSVRIDLVQKGHRLWPSRMLASYLPASSFLRTWWAFVWNDSSSLPTSSLSSYYKPNNHGIYEWILHDPNMTMTRREWGSHNFNNGHTYFQRWCYWTKYNAQKFCTHQMVHYPRPEYMNYLRAH
jgi:hypothetical protein